MYLLLDFLSFFFKKRSFLNYLFILVGGLVFQLDRSRNLLEPKVNLCLEKLLLPAGASRGDGSDARLKKGSVLVRPLSAIAFHSVPLGPMCLHFS